MVTNEIKMKVAENCPGYHSRFLFSSMSLGTFSTSCSNCVNFVRGKCTKNLYDGIRETIRVN
jgi:hypothetical protein